jgi:uncharacterized protein (DUF2062 family)
MLFKRRNQESIFQRVLLAVWPRRTWQRSAQYVSKRVVRISATPHGIAAGFAAGVFASCTPLMGFHFLLSAFLAVVTRGSLIASAFGTVIGNPLTFPFIWTTSYAIGRVLLGYEAADGIDPNPIEIIQEHGFSPSGLKPVFLPMVIGGLVLGSIGWCVSYFPLRYTVRRYRAARQALIDAKAARKASKLARKQNAAPGSGLPGSGLPDSGSHVSGPHGSGPHGSGPEDAPNATTTAPAEAAVSVDADAVTPAGTRS